MTAGKKVTIDGVRDVVRLQLGVFDVAATDHLVEDLSAASVDIVNIVATLEEKYDIEIDEQALADLYTVTDLFNIADRQARDER